MSVAEVIGVLSGLVIVISTFTASIVAVLNTRTNAAALVLAQKKIDQVESELEESRNREETSKRDIIWIGEAMGGLRNDNAKLALVFNQLYNDFERVTGSKPPIDMEMLRNMQTIQYITGPLGPLDIQDTRGWSG